MRTLAATLAAALVLSGCAALRESRLNPFNWFDRSEPAAAVPAEATEAADPRRPVAQVTALAVEPRPGGAILRATGLPPAQGHWDVALVPDPVEEGATELTFRLVVQPPPVPRPVGTPRSREVTAAVFVGDHRLEGIRRITVTGETGARSVSRR